jgi:hypothetical protein
MDDHLSASSLVDEACEELGYSLAKLVALASVWIHPDVIKVLAPVDGVWYPDRRRANLGLRREGVQLERVGQRIEGITLDDNTYANTAFKRALGVERQSFTGFHVCHIWPGTAYDPACFTQLANLVGIPAELSSLTDHHSAIVACLEYRAWELYGWRPRQESAPSKPAEYPERWREPYAANEAGLKAARRRVGTAAQPPLPGSNPPLPPNDPRPPLPSGDELRERAMMAALYLARFEHQALRLGNQGETVDRIAAALSTKSATLRNYRDYFDAHVPSPRRGWWQYPLPPGLSAILARFGATPEPELRAMVLRFIEPRPAG